MRRCVCRHEDSTSENSLSRAFRCFVVKNKKNLAAKPKNSKPVEKNHHTRSNERVCELLLSKALNRFNDDDDDESVVVIEVIKFKNNTNHALK